MSMLLPMAVVATLVMQALGRMTNFSPGASAPRSLAVSLSGKKASGRLDTRLPRLKPQWLKMPEPRVWPERPTPPLDQTELDF